MAIHLATNFHSADEFIRLERQTFAAKIRLARAVLGWSQTVLGAHVGLTQRAIHKLERGETEPRRTTVLALENIWHTHQIEFEDLAEGGFRASFRSPVFGGMAKAKSRRTQS